MVAYNEITRKEVTTIDLRQAIGVTDLNPEASTSVPATAVVINTPGSRGMNKARTMSMMLDDDEGMGMGMFGARPRSFRVDFKGGEGIVFSADRDTDKATW